MIALLVLFVLLLLVFGGLGLFVAKLFFVGLLAALVIALIAGAGALRGA